jgi:ABC-type uncharacterized transport system substrate-binding protein
MEFKLNKHFFVIVKYCLVIVLSGLLSLFGVNEAISADNSNMAIAADGLNIRKTADGSNIAVIYPQVREPYIRIFKEIISGITDTIPQPVRQYAISKISNIEDMKSKLIREGIDSVIVLGSRAQKMTPALAEERTVLTGAVFSIPTATPIKFSGISMIASPDVLLKKLVNLVPEVKTVHVVYNKKKDGWIIEYAKHMLEQQGIVLNAMPSDDVRSRARFYNDLFKSKSLSKTDAVWLLQSDSSLKEPGVFATILENAWKQSFIVFSANPTHVRKGVLFAMYPDNRKLGISLANKMLSLRNGSHHSVEPLSDLLVAVNIRTAEHLELDFSRSERQSFNMVFPNR